VCLVKLASMFHLFMRKILGGKGSARLLGPKAGRQRYAL
jgi:hypothetical protein